MLGLYYDGKWQESTEKDVIEVENPATLKITGEVISASPEDVDLAIASAKKAFQTWSTTPIEQRMAYVEQLLTRLRDDQENLAKTVEYELGCGPAFALKTHVKPYLEDIENYLRLTEEFPFVETYDGYEVLREPFGVVGCLTPWNYPLGQIEKKLIPAVLMGNTVVLKPSQNTPLIAVELFKHMDAVGFPPGVVNLICGRGSDIGNLIATHEDVDMVTFTGSTGGGQAIARLAAGRVKPTLLELGGKSAAVILEGADLNLAIKRTLGTVYYNTGQTCSAYSRLLAPLSMKEEVEETIKRLTETFPFSKNSSDKKDIGPLASKKQYEKVLGYIKKGQDEGATLLLGDLPTTDGYYVGPVVFTDVTNDMSIAQEEIFGPVLSVIYYHSEEEALEIANDSQYGLSGAVYGEPEKAKAFAKKMKTGGVAINEGSSSHNAPFGGYKMSGYGREGGMYGLKEFTQTKTLHL